MFSNIFLFSTSHIHDISNSCETSKQRKPYIQNILFMDKVLLNRNTSVHLVKYMTLNVENNRTRMDRYIYIYNVESMCF